MKTGAVVLFVAVLVLAVVNGLDSCAKDGFSSINEGSKCKGDDCNVVSTEKDFEKLQVLKDVVEKQQKDIDHLKASIPNKTMNNREPSYTEIYKALNEGITKVSKDQAEVYWRYPLQGKNVTFILVTKQALYADAKAKCESIPGFGLARDPENDQLYAEIAADIPSSSSVKSVWLQEPCPGDHGMAIDLRELPTVQRKCTKFQQGMTYCYLCEYSRV